jgi:SAM-dependent methyltransferase
MAPHVLDDTSRGVFEEALKLRLQNPQLEIEARFTRKISAEQFTHLSKVLAETFPEREIQPEVLDVNFYTSSIKKDNDLSMRYTITGLDNIQAYCRTDRFIQGKYTKMYKSRITWGEKVIVDSRISPDQFSKDSIFIAVPDFDIRINVKEELLEPEFDQYATDMDTRVQSNLNTDSLFKIFRYKKRVSYISASKQFRVDMTVVKTNKTARTVHGREEVVPTKTFSASNCLNEHETYEVELEWVGNPVDYKKHMAKFDELLAYLHQNLFSRTSSLLGNSAVQRVCTEYTKEIKKTAIATLTQQIGELNDLVDGKEPDSANPYSLWTSHSEKLSELRKPGAKIENNHVFRTLNGALNRYKRMREDDKKTNLFYCPKVISMNIENVVESFPRNIVRNYTVTDKADGETMILYIDTHGTAYFIDTNMNVHLAAVKTKYRHCILVGEFVSHPIIGFYCFDCYMVNEKDVRMLPLVSSGTAEQESRIGLANTVISSIDTSIVPLNVKKFYEYNVDGTDPMGVFSRSKMLWDTYLAGGFASKYKLDGLVYTPCDMPVGFEPTRFNWSTQWSARWNYNMKWKPPAENTIDFLVEIEADPVHPKRDRIQYHTISVGGVVVETIPYKTVHLYCGYNVPNPCGAGNANTGQAKYIPTRFTPTNPLNEMAYIAHIRCDTARNNNIYGEDNMRIQTKTIVEFAYNPNPQTPLESLFSWHPLRTRLEKTESFEIAQKERKMNHDILKEVLALSPRDATQFRYNAKILKLMVLIEKMNLQPFPKTRDAASIYETLTTDGNRDMLSKLSITETPIDMASSYGNDFEIANEIWRSIHYPITTDMITTGGNVPTAEEAEGVYYNRDLEVARERSITLPMQKFHNEAIKGHELLEKAVSRIRGSSKDTAEIHLLDLACGKGGDLFKWARYGITHVVGIELFHSNIYDAKDGACMRYIQYKKRSEGTAENNIQVDFLYGDVSRNILSGKSMKDDHSREKQAEVWSAKQYSTRGFDMISIQFAIHYLFETEEKLNGLITNISQNLRDGGYFVGCCFDGNAVYKHPDLYGKPAGTSISGMKDGHVIWRITKEYNDSAIVNDELKTGVPISVFIHSINPIDPIREYLVGYDYLVEKLAEKQIYPIENGTALFGEVYAKYVSAKTAADTRVAQLSLEEQRLSFLNRFFIFQKETSRVVSAKPVPTVESKKSKKVAAVKKQKDMAAAEAPPVVQEPEVKQANAKPKSNTFKTRYDKVSPLFPILEEPYKQELHTKYQLWHDELVKLSGFYKPATHNMPEEKARLDDIIQNLKDKLK